MKFSKVHTILVIAILLFGGIVFSSVLRPVSAQTAQATVVPTQPIVNPTGDQETIKDLETRVKTLEEKVIPISIIATVLGLFGLSSPLLVRSWFLKKQKEALNEAFYKADPRNFPMYIPKRNFEIEKRRLKKLGFKKLTEYEFLSEVGSKGIIVYSVSGSDFKDETIKKKAVQELKELEEYIRENENAPYAYVIYIKGQLGEASSLAGSYDNVVPANTPITIAGHAYTLARGLMD